MLTKEFYVNGNGSSQFIIPKGYKFMTVENATPYNVNVYSDIDTTIGSRIMFVPIYTILPMALDTVGTVEKKVNIVWTGTGVNKIIVKCSLESPGPGQTLVPPGGGASFVLIGDSVGLVKTSDFITKMDAVIALLGYEKTMMQQLNETDAVTGVLTFTDLLENIEIYNTDPSNPGTFIVNGLTILVPATEIFSSKIAGVPGYTVTITGSTSYIVSSYQ